MTAPLRAAGGMLLLATGGLLQTALLTDLPRLEHRAGDRESNTVAVWGAHALEQTVRPEGPNVSAVEFWIFGPKGVPLAGTVTVRLRRQGSADDVRAASVEARRLPRSDGTRFTFNPLPTSAEETLVLRLEFPEGTEDAPLLVRAERPEPTTGGWSDYEEGALRRDGETLQADLAFRTYARGRAPFGQQAVAAALLGGLAVLLSAVRRLRRVVPLTLLAVGLPVVFALPLLASPTFLGTGDWDMNTTMHAAAERALNRERQLPGWNPYLCGGTPLIGFPESPVFSPFFATVLLGGPVLGFKVNVVLHLMIGFVGMLVWLRRGWRLSWPASFFGASVVIFSSFVTLHLFAGHTRKVAIAWIPWVFFFLQRALQEEESSKFQAPSTKLQSPIRSRYWNFRHGKLFGAWDLELGAWRGLRSAAPAGAALALMFFDGSVYLSLFTALFVALVGIGECLRQRRVRPLLVAAATVALGGLLAGAQLGPVLASERFSSLDLDGPNHSLPARGILDVFLDPNQTPYAMKYFSQPQPWHEYGAYVGLGAVVLAVAGTAASARRLAPWLLAGAVFFLGAFFLPAQRVLAALPILDDLRNPQRMSVMVTVVIALAAAAGFDRLRRWLTAGDVARARPVSAALTILAILAVGQTIFVSSETLAKTFRVAPPPAVPNSAFRQGWARLIPVGEEDSFVFTTENARRNIGSVNRCSVASVQPSEQLRLPDEPDRDRGLSFRAGPYEGEAFVLSGRGRVTVLEQTTNTARLRYVSETPATLALNMNAQRGWTAEVVPEGGARRRGAAERQNKLVSAGVPAGSGTVTFRYRPPGLGWGIATTVVGAGLALWLWRRGNHHG